MISPYSNETVDLLNIVSAKYHRELEKFPVLEKYVHKFLMTELMKLHQDETTQEVSHLFAF